MMKNKKLLVLSLCLLLCAALLCACGSSNPAPAATPAPADAAPAAEAPAEPEVKVIDTLHIAFSPYADADQIITATEPLEALLQAKLLEKGYDVKHVDMTVGTSYTAVGEALSAGSADIGFMSGGNYVLFSDDCDVLLTALRYAINKDSLNPADWNDGTIEENTSEMSTYYRCIVLAGPSEKGQALAEKVKKTYTVSDIDTAAVIYNTVRSISDPNDLMEYFLGAVYAAGIETGKRRERERQRKVRERARRGSK